MYIVTLNRDLVAVHGTITNSRCFYIFPFFSSLFTPSNTQEVLRYYLLPPFLSAATDITIDGDTFSEGLQQNSPGSSAATLLLDSPPNCQAKVHLPFFFEGN